MLKHALARLDGAALDTFISSTEEQITNLTRDRDNRVTHLAIIEQCNFGDSDKPEIAKLNAEIAHYELRLSGLDRALDIAKRERNGRPLKVRFDQVARLAGVA